MLSSTHPAASYHPSSSAEMSSRKRRIIAESDEVLVDADTDSDSSFYTKKQPAIAKPSNDDLNANQKRSNFNARKSVVVTSEVAAASPIRKDALLASLKRTIEFPLSKEKVPDLQVIPRSSDEEDNDDDMISPAKGKTVPAVTRTIVVRWSLETDSSVEGHPEETQNDVDMRENPGNGHDTPVTLGAPHFTNELDVSNGATAHSVTESSTSDSSSGNTFQPSASELVKMKARNIDVYREKSKNTAAEASDVDAFATNKNHSIQHWKQHIAPVLQYCGVCAPCKEEPCGECRLCITMKGKLSGRRSEGQSRSKMKLKFSYCLFKCCVRHYKVKNSHTLPVIHWYRDELDYTRRVLEQQLIKESQMGPKYFRFQVDMPVYCWWPDSQAFFEAKIFHRYTVKIKGHVSKLYSVHFTDGSNDKRSRVPEREILTRYQMQVLLERDRYETIMENLNPASDNLVDDGAFDNPVDDGAFDNPVDDGAFDNDIDDGATEVSPTNAVTTECQPSKNTLDTTAATIIDTYFDDWRRRSKRNIRDDADGGATSPSKKVCPDSIKSSLSPTRYFSKARKVGRRCFFRWPGKSPLYHSGVIIGKETAGNEIVFIIQAEYNNSLKKFKVSSHLVFSESKYMRFEHQLPPNDRAEMATLIDNDTMDSEPCAPQMVTPDFVGSGGAGPATTSTRRVYSTSKILGARCYARWHGNGNYYWGYIQKVTGQGLTRRYSVRFEDGDSCHGIRPWQLFSEAEFKRRTRSEPPEPKGQGINVDENTVEPSAAHALFGLGFCQNWIDFAGRHRITYGKIGHAIDASDNSDNTFEVTYFKDADISDDVVTPQLLDTVSEKVAWGGYMAYIDAIEPEKYTTEASQIPFHVKWMMPDFRKYDNLGCLIMKFRGFRLCLAPHESTMPGAGLGLFLSVVDVSGASRSHFVLSEGELLCLGPYGPFCPSDCKKIHVFEVKSFIHEFSPESYCFESKDFFVDITDDQTGELHALATRSLMCRVNETDGMDIPCVCAERDPSGSILYFLGHDTEGQGDLSIPVDTPYELKIDYGDLYERQRVRCNYPRIKGRALGNTRRSIELSDQESLQDFSLYTPKEIHECLLFLESIFNPTWATAKVKLQRSLIVALTLRRRSLATQVDGFDDMDPHHTVQRSNLLVKSICDSFGDREQFRHGVLSCSLLKSVVVELFGGVDASTVDSLPTAVLYNKIVSGN